MIETATAINSLPSHARQADFAKPADDPVFILTSGQLQEIIKEGIQPALDRIEALEDRVAALEEENATLRLKLASLESTQEQDTTRICIDIAQDRQRIAKLEKGKPGPTGEERIEKLQGYLKDKKSAGSRPEASFTEARTYLEVSRSQFSQLISKLDPRDFVISPNPLNYKSKMIGLSHKM